MNPAGAFDSGGRGKVGRTLSTGLRAFSGNPGMEGKSASSQAPGLRSQNVYRYALSHRNSAILYQFWRLIPRRPHHSEQFRPFSSPGCPSGFRQPVFNSPTRYSRLRDCPASGCFRSDGGRPANTRRTGQLASYLQFPFQSELPDTLAGDAPAHGRHADADDRPGLPDL